jgi:hypothetical protein
LRNYIISECILELPKIQHTGVDGIGLLVWDLNAELLLVVSLYTIWLWPEFMLASSMAITTSTVSKLSKPRSLLKCEVAAS